MIESIPIRRKRGQTSSFDIIFSTDDGEALLLDGTVELVVTAEANPTDSDTPIMTLSGAIQSPANIVRFTPSPADADNVGFFYYEVKHTSAGGAIRPLLEGEFLIEETRAH